MEKISELTRKDVIISEKNKVLEKVVKIEIDIAVLETQAPTMIVAIEKTPLATNARGEAMSYHEREITVKERIEKDTKDLSQLMVRLNTLEKLLKKV